MILAVLFFSLFQHKGHATQDAGTQWLEYGRSQMRARQYSTAVTALSNAAQLSPENPAVFKELGNAYYYEGDLALAKRNYVTSLKLNPTDVALKIFLEKLGNISGPIAGRAPKQTAATMVKGNWVAPALMSMALPGAGQFYDGKPLRAFVFGVPTLALLGGAAAAYSIGEDANKRYAASEGSAEDVDEAYNTWQRMAPIFGACAFLGLSMYVWTVVDAAVHVPSHSIAAASNLSFEMVMLPGGMRARYRIARF